MNGTFVRVGKTNKAADNEMLLELERQRLNKSFDEDICREVDENSVVELTHVLENVLEKKITIEKLANLNLIIKTGKIDYFSNAAMIVLGLLDNCCIKCARFTGDSVHDFIDRKEYTGNIFEQLHSAIGFIKSHINVSGIISGGGIKRRDVLEIPEEVFREAILNAIIHRDYSITGSDIKIAIFNSRIDIVSPGGLPKTITVEEIYAGRSEIRNKILARIFREAGIFEQWGSSIPRIREVCEKESLKPPEISEGGMFVKLTIYRKAEVSTVNEKKVVYESLSKTAIIEKEKEQICNLLNENSGYTLKDISRIVGISESSVQRRLDALQKDNRIIRIGSKKSGKWLPNRI